jgi:hypothetical protein
LDSRKDRTDNIFTKREKLPLRNSRELQDRPPLQMRTITYNDKTAGWSRSNQVMGTRWLPSVITFSPEPRWGTLELR